RRPPRSTPFPYTTLFRSVDTVRDNGLARFEGQLPAVEVNVHDVWLERHEPRHVGHLGPCLDVGPGGTLVLPDVVVAGQALVRARSEEHTSELQSRFDLVC